MIETIALGGHRKAIAEKTGLTSRRKTGSKCQPSKECVLPNDVLNPADFRAPSVLRRRSGGRTDDG